MPLKLLAIVLHGSGRYYLEPLFAENRMPRLAAMATAGHQRYFQTALPIAAGAWVTLLTGQPVSEHGVIDWIDRDARAYDGMAGRMASSTSYSDRTIHTVLSAAGQRVASIYLPMTAPPWPVNGAIVSGFPLPDERRPPTYPPELGHTLPAFGAQKLFSIRYGDTAAVDEYLRTNLAAVERATTDALRSGAYDVVLTCLPAPDLAHHYFWRPGDRAALEQIYDVYDQVDSVMGRLFDQVDPSTTVVVFSDHGGREAPSRLFGVNRWLADAGYLAPAGRVSGPGRLVGLMNRAINLAKKHRLNHAAAALIGPGLRKRLSAVTHNTAFVDWSRSRAYGLDFICPLAGVEINLAGRQARGLVTSAAYEPLRDEIVSRMTTLVDPDTKRRVFSRVVRREEMFDGPYVERFPDVIGVLTDEYDVKGQLDLPAFGPNVGSSDYPFMGYHGHDAYFAVRGPGISPGVGPSAGAMESVAPTLLKLVGVTPPGFMHARPFEW